MINSKFPILVATALALPIVTYADIKIYGQIGAEAASVEYAARRWIGRAGRVSLENKPTSFLLRFGIRDRHS